MAERVTIIAGNPLVEYDSDGTITSVDRQGLAFKTALTRAIEVQSDPNLELSRIYVALDHAGRLDPITTGENTSHAKFRLDNLSHAFAGPLLEICDELNIDPHEVRVMGEGITRASVIDSIRRDAIPTSVSDEIAPISICEEDGCEGRRKVVCQGIAYGSFDRAGKHAERVEFFVEYRPVRTHPRIFLKGIGSMRRARNDTRVVVRYCVPKKDGTIFVSTNWYTDEYFSLYKPVPLT